MVSDMNWLINAPWPINPANPNSIYYKHYNHSGGSGSDGPFIVYGVVCLLLCAFVLLYLWWNDK